MFSPFFTNAEAQTIQQLIDEAEPGETILLDEGEYDEPIIINKPIHLLGDENVTLTHSGSQPIITIQADHVEVENIDLQYTNNESESPAILINSDHNSFNQIKIDTNSYGFQFDQANKNTLSHVSITGNERKSIKNRKPGIDLWESHNNEIYDTQIKYVQDGIYIEKSNANKIHRNRISHSRYGTHLMFTKNTELSENESFENVSGLYIMGAEGTVAKQNTLRDNQENIQSLGLYVFDTTDATITENTIVNNRIGIFIESASDNRLDVNKVQENYIGMQFKGAESNEIVNNSFVSNVVQGQATESFDNHTNQNYWGDHLGLDITGDQTSDLAYKVDPFFLNVTSEYPPFQLLFQSPGMIFLEQLISTPADQQFVDESPLMENPLADSDNQPVNPWTLFLFCMSLLIISLFIIYLGVRKNEKI